MRHPTRLATAALATLATLTLTLASPAGAASRTPVAMTVHTAVDAATARFTATVPGCESGVVTDIDPRTTFNTRGGGTFTGTKSFACDEGGGFDVRLAARFGPGGSVGSWHVVSGSGGFAGLKGQGALVGIPSSIGIDDIYTGLFR